MSQTVQETPLKVAALGFAPRMVQTFRLFFQGPCSGRCALVDEEAAAEFLLVDVDSPDGVGHWRRLGQSQGGRPVVAVSLREPTPAPAWFLSKPVGKEAFLALLAQLEPEVRKAPERPVPAPAPAPKPAEPPARKSKSFGQSSLAARTTAAARTLEAASFSHFINSVPEADPRDAAQRARSTYDPERHLQGHLQRAYAQAASSGRPQRLRGPWRDIFIFPESREVLADLPEARLRSMTVVPISGASQAQLIPLTPAEAASVREASPKAPESQEAFLWKVALWSSRGRLPAGTTWELPVRLRRWPNLTRLVLTPHAFQLAALWVRRPLSPLEAAGALKVPQPAVFAFYSAAQAAGLMDQHAAAVPTAQPAARGVGRGLLARILGRLRGG